MDISSAFFIIPIKQEHRHKTAFWVNDKSYEFNVAVMGLKSSPYHLKKFMEVAFSKTQLDKIIKLLTPEERKHIPNTFDQMIITYFDDGWIYADTYEELLTRWKAVLLACRAAKIKFSAEKCTFMTKNIKILGYSFNTEDVILTMDKLKSSAIMNMKKPSSLFELHSRLCSFQYQQNFLPFLKHILYPLHFLLRTR